MKHNYVNAGGVRGVEEAERDQQVSILRKSLLVDLGSALSCPLENRLCLPALTLPRCLSNRMIIQRLARPKRIAEKKVSQ